MIKRFLIFFAVLGAVLSMTSPASAEDVSAPNTIPLSEADNPIDMSAPGAGAIYTYCVAANYSNLGIRVRASHYTQSTPTEPSNYEEFAFVLQPGTYVGGVNDWSFMHAFVAENHYAQVNVISKTDGKSRVYNIWGPFTIIDDGKARLNIMTYRYTTSTKSGVIEQVI